MMRKGAVVVRVQQRRKEIGCAEVLQNSFEE